MPTELVITLELVEPMNLGSLANFIWEVKLVEVFIKKKKKEICQYPPK